VTVASSALKLEPKKGVAGSWHQLGRTECARVAPAYCDSPRFRRTHLLHHPEANAQKFPRYCCFHSFQREAGASRLAAQTSVAALCARIPRWPSRGRQVSGNVAAGLRRDSQGRFLRIVIHGIRTVRSGSRFLFIAATLPSHSRAGNGPPGELLLGGPSLLDTSCVGSRKGLAAGWVTPLGGVLRCLLQDG
jgi:hypothetical protein